MKISMARFALLSSVSSAFAAFVLPQAAVAQATICSQTGTDITCVDGGTTVLTATASPGTTTVAGPGLRAVNATAPATIAYIATGSIATTSVNAVNLTSTGGPLVFVPEGTTAPVNISTTGGAAANGVLLNSTGQTATVTVGNISTTGTSSFGVRSNGGTDLTLRTGDITTTGGPTFPGGQASRGISATQQTGVIDIIAGNLTATDRGLSVFTLASATAVVGNVSAGTAGLLVSTNDGNATITTGDVTAANGFGVFGQVVSATGTGNVVIRTGAVNNALGTGFGGASGVGGFVANAAGGVDIGCSSVTSISPNSAAVSAQNVGTGALTINCGAVSNVGNNAVFAQSSGIPDGGNIAITTTSVAASDTAFSTLFAQTAGTGTITVNAGTVIGGANAAGIGGTGIDLIGGTGAIDAGYGNVTTTGTALRAVSTGTVNLRGAGSTLTTSGAAATGAVITSAGVTGNLGNVTTTGIGAQGAIVTSTAPVNLTIGNVATTGNGVTINAGANAVTLTTGTVAATEAGATGTVINSTGAVNFIGGRQSANGANALAINGGAGAINATVAGAATTGDAGAVAVSGTGPVTFANTATISTVGANATGVNIAGVTTAAVNCGNITTSGANSPAFVLAANGTTNVTCGNLTTTGATSDAIAVTNATGTTTVTGGTTSATGAGSRGIVVASSAPAATGVVTVNTGTVTANGNAVAASSTGGANVVVNATGNVASTTGTGITATTGGTTQVAIAAGTTTSGIEGVSLQGTAGNTLIVNGTLRNTGGTTPYTVLAGGPFTLTLGANGSIVGPLAFTTGNDTFNNQGTFALPATIDFLGGADVVNNSGTFTAFTGTSAIANLETFNNSGLIEMRDGAANDVVNLGSANFAGSGGSRLGLDIGGDASGFTADRLVLGGNASGTTALNLNFLAGSAVVDTNGVLLVDAASATGNPFTFAGPSSNGLINFALQQNGGDTFLVSTVDEVAFDALTLNAMTKEAAYQSIDAHIACSASRRSAADEGQNSISLCGQLYASNDKIGRNRTQTAFGTSLNFNDRRKTDRKGAQLEVGFKVGGAFKIGATGGYTHGKTDLRSGSDIDVEGHNIGGFVEFGGSSGLYASATGQYGDFNVRLGNGTVLPQVRIDGRTKSADGEVGFRAGRFAGAAFDAHVGVSYVRTRLDDFVSGNVAFDNRSFDTFRGRAGPRLTFDGAIAPFIDGRVYREFKGSNDIRLGSGLTFDNIEGRRRGTWGRIEAGLAGNGMISGWVDVGDVTGYGVRAGFRF